MIDTDKYEGLKVGDFVEFMDIHDSSEDRGESVDWKFIRVYPYNSAKMNMEYHGMNYEGYACDYVGIDAEGRWVDSWRHPDHVFGPALTVVEQGAESRREFVSRYLTKDEAIIIAKWWYNGGEEYNGTKGLPVLLNAKDNYEVIYMGDEEE